MYAQGWGWDNKGVGEAGRVWEDGEHGESEGSQTEHNRIVHTINLISGNPHHS